MLKKVGEETAEVIIASKNPGNGELIYEISDLMYHLSVLMVERGVTYEDIFEELSKRR
ncbi:MAG: Phosphoribosyl-ATP pyrophosphatase [Firmicutes bacterium ADurb.Bin419]|nr:MAG: Phosphoribosyl-ATP pyrophosphatase [Firmicutes bacterium ADurb.Bin419]